MKQRLACHLVLWLLASTASLAAADTYLLRKAADRQEAEPPKPAAHTERQLEGWTIRVDNRLLQPPNDALGRRALRFLEHKLADIKAVVPADRLHQLQAVPIVLDLTHGQLRSMQYHPSAGWLRAHGYAAELAKCVHIPRAADLPTQRNINEQPWVILHELAHAYHDQVLAFDEPRIRAASAQYQKSGHGEKTLRFNGQRVRHYALTDHKEFFAEMTEAYFGVNDFFPFNRAELKEAEPEIAALLHDIWESAAGARSGAPPKQPTAREAVPAQAMLSVADFLPKGYVTDGSVGYQQEIQQAIDAAAHAGRPVVFPAMVYRLNESGLQLRSRSTLWLYGAVFRFDAHCTKAGHAFVGHDVSDVRLLGGEIIGRNDAWPAGVSIRGVHLTGRSQNIRIRDMHLHDLSSNGIGIFGHAEQPIRDVWITDVVIANCCNRYGDYLSDRPGPEKGSQREDQGLVAFYHVEDFVVRGCRLEKSRSDGTHFYHCRRGQFVANKVYAAQMGGYFVESCEDVLAADNLIRDNGSRGCTIERGSKNCTLKGCIVAASGREGLWAPDCTGLVVTDNVFDRNGRKPNGKQAHQMWNANITVNHDPHDPTKSSTQDYLIAHNILYTAAGQAAAIRVDANQGTTGIVVKDNLLRGENRTVLIEGDGRANVAAQRNE